MLNEEEFASSFEAIMDTKAHSSLSKLLLNGALAGLAVSFAGYGYLVAQATGAGTMGGALIFCTGFVLVVFLQAELFTGNMILSVGVVGGRFSLGKMLRSWGWVYLVNFVVSMLTAIGLYIAGGLDSHGEMTALGEVAERVMHHKTERSMAANLIRGVACNILVVGAYVMALFSRDPKGKVLCILFPVTLFVLCGFEQCVANMFLLPFGFLAAGLPLSQWGGPLFHNLIPVTIGNILGGMAVLFLQPRFIQMIRQQTRMSEKLS